MVPHVNNSSFCGHWIGRILLRANVPSLHISPYSCDFPPGASDSLSRNVQVEGIVAAHLLIYTLEVNLSISVNLF